MPITANCPNPACGKALSVADQYAGMQGKCPFCGTIFTFPSAAPPPPPPLPAMPEFVAPPVAPAGGPPPISAPWETGPGPAVARGPGLPIDLLNLILTSAGLFFLLLFFIATLLPWITRGIFPSSNAFGAAAGIILFIFDLLILLGVGAAFVLSLVLVGNKIVQMLLTYGIAAAAWLGVLAFFLTLAGIFRPWGLGEGAKDYDDPATREAVRKAIGVGFGVWMAFISSLGIAGIFGFLAFQRPPELPSSNPFVRRWLLLVCVLGSAAFIGFLVMIIHII